MHRVSQPALRVEPPASLCWSVCGRSSRVEPHEAAPLRVRTPALQKSSPPANMANATNIRNTSIAKPKRSFAIPAVVADPPEKPKKPAATETTAAIKAHFNIVILKRPVIRKLGRTRAKGGRPQHPQKAILASFLVLGRRHRVDERVVLEGVQVGPLVGIERLNRSNRGLVDIQHQVILTFSRWNAVREDAWHFSPIVHRGLKAGTAYEIFAARMSNTSYLMSPKSVWTACVARVPITGCITFLFEPGLALQGCAT